MEKDQPPDENNTINVILGVKEGHVEGAEEVPADCQPGHFGFMSPSTKQMIETTSGHVKLYCFMCGMVAVIKADGPDLVSSPGQRQELIDAGLDKESIEEIDALYAAQGKVFQ